MREIKFRGIRIPEKTWVYGDLVKGDGYFNIGFSEIHDGYKIIKSCLVMTDTVGQYTGLKDVKNQEIYEGDILCGSPGAFVRYDEAGARFVIDVLGNINQVHFMDILQKDLEVIGNVHEDSKGGEEIQCEKI